MRPGVTLVHKLIALVVENYRTAQAALLKPLGRGENQAGLSCAQESADEHNPRLFVRFHKIHLLTVMRIS
jgi:hypothetical protein